MNCVLANIIFPPRKDGNQKMIQMCLQLKKQENKFQLSCFIRASTGKFDFPRNSSSGNDKSTAGNGLNDFFNYQS